MYTFAAILVAAVTLATHTVEGQGQTADCSKYNPDTPCPRSLIPMCGNDRVTYSNECVFCQRQREARNSGRAPPAYLHSGDCEEENKAFRSLDSNPAFTTRVPTEEPEKKSVASLLWPWLRPQTAAFYDRWESQPAWSQVLNAEPQFPSERPSFAYPVPRLPRCRGLDGRCPSSAPVCTSIGHTFQTECHVCDYNRYVRGEQTLIVRDGPCQ